MRLVDDGTPVSFYVTDVHVTVNNVPQVPNLYNCISTHSISSDCQKIDLQLYRGITCTYASSCFETLNLLSLHPHWWRFHDTGENYMYK